MLITVITLALALIGSSGPPPSDEALRSYFTNMDAADPSPALDVSSPGAAAWRYVEHQSALESAYRAVGEPALMAEIFLRPQGVQRCLTTQDGEALGCTMFSDFTTDADGLIESFSVDGTSIVGRIGDPTELVVVGPLTVSIRSSYRAVTSDVLFVTLRIETSSDLELNRGLGAVYIGPDGVQRESQEGVGPATLYGGATTTVAVTFPAADPGGRLIWELFAGECCEQYRLELNVPALGEGLPVGDAPIAV